jgi:hypothetical protein
MWHARSTHVKQVLTHALKLYLQLLGITDATAITTATRAAVTPRRGRLRRWWVAHAGGRIVVQREVDGRG